MEHVLTQRPPLLVALQLAQLVTFYAHVVRDMLDDDALLCKQFLGILGMQVGRDL